MKIPQASGTQTNEAKVFTCAGGGAAFVESPRDYPLMEIPITSADHRAHLGGQCCTPYCVRDGLLPTTPDCCVESIPIISSLTCAFRTNQSTPYALFSTIPSPLLSTAGSVVIARFRLYIFSRPNQCYSSTIHSPVESTCGVLSYGEFSQAFRSIILSTLLTCQSLRSAGQLLGLCQYEL